MMKRIVWALVIVAVLVGGAYAVFRDPGRIHIYSKDGLPLAETQAEAFCAGFVYWQTGGDPEMMVECIADVTASASTGPPPMNMDVDHQIVLLSFCTGAREAGFPGNISGDCQTPLRDMKLWPTLYGTLTAQWSKTYPYPLDVFGGGHEQPERGADRPGFERQGKTP